MRCKFCGCTDARACAIPMLLTADEDVVGRPASIAIVGAQEPEVISRFDEPCHWIAPNVCSAPKCVDRAYDEICEREDLAYQQFSARELARKDALNSNAATISRGVISSWVAL